MVTSDLHLSHTALEWPEALAELGERQEVRSNRPIELLDRSSAWWVLEGSLELFAIGGRALGEPADGGGQIGRRTHLLSVGAGRFVFNLGRFAETQRTCRLIAVSLDNAVLLRIPIGALARLSSDPQMIPHLAQGVDRWIVSLFVELLDQAAPKDFASLVVGQEVQLAAGQAARPDLALAWIRHVQGSSRFLGRESLRIEPGDELIPLAERTWIEAEDGEAVERLGTVHGGSAGSQLADATAEDDPDDATLGLDRETDSDDDGQPEPVKASVRLSVVSTEVLLRGGRLWVGLDRFHDLYLEWLEHRLVELEAVDGERLDRRLRLDRRALQSASEQLASALGGERGVLAPPPREVANDLLKVCRWVGGVVGIEIKAPRPTTRVGRTEMPLRQICAASRIRSRTVMLRDDWWRRDNGPLIGFKLESDSNAEGAETAESSEVRRPVALLPSSSRSYVLVDPSDAVEVKVDGQVAEGLAPDGYMLYPPLPERPVNVVDILRLAFADRWRDLSTLILTGAATGLLALAVPLITARLFGEVIPDADRPQLLLLTLALGVSALTATAFRITRSIAMVRLGGKIDGSVQAALWDRLLSMPVSFFKRFTVGDLAKRAMGMDTIREALIGRVLGAVLSAVFSIFSFVLLFWFSTSLALVALGLVGLLALLTLTMSWIELRYQRRLLDLQGRLSSLVFGLIHGIAKLRLAGAEHRGYSLWAEKFAEQRRVAWRARTVSIVQISTNAAYGVFTLLILFGMVGLSLRADLTVSQFLGFNAAFGQFQAAVLSMISVISSVLSLVPVYDRLRPILKTWPEVDDSKAEADELTGDVDLSHVSFRYSQDGPLILDDVSIRAHAGEFIALVGPSGSGKSTTLRLVLGFEEPNSGSLYFDGQDLPSLNLQSVRRQIGVVLQNARPIAGDILSNIVGSTSLTIEDAWHAAEVAGLADDIKAMPMGMHTLVSEGAGTFSGGQKQRLMIARAVAHKPRILLFDEATSALDNRIQDVVSQSLARLKATRIVVAHRLSTVVHADRIYVLDKGRVVQQGSYEELMVVDGLFRRLAERQIA